MDSQYTAIIKRQDDWWIGWIEEVPGVNCQEHSRKRADRKSSRDPPGSHRVQPSRRHSIGRNGIRRRKHSCIGMKRTELLKHLRAVPVILTR